MREHDELGRFKTQEKAELNPAWKGEAATVGSIHCWVRDNFTPEPKCEICGCVNDGMKQFDWSNKDHKYSRDRKDWQHVCRACHNEYDYTHNNRPRPYSFHKGKWSMKYDKCIRCGRNNVKYKSNGMCSNCYRIQYDNKEKTN